MKTSAKYFFLFALVAIHAHILLAQAPSYLPQTGLVGWWPFSGNANDSSGNGNNGTISGAAQTTDRFGVSNRAYQFNGVNSFISVPNSTSLQNINKITMSAWVKIDNWHSTGGQFWFPILHKSNQQFQYGKYSVALNSTGLIYHLDSWENGPAYSGWNFNSWFHVLVTVSDDSSAVYINGAKHTKVPNGVFPQIPVQNLPLIFGRDTPGLVEYANGKIDDIAIWNRVLSDSEINSFYQGSIEHCQKLGSFNPLSDSSRICGNSKILDAGSGFTNYLWNTGATSQSITATQSGKYKVTVTNAQSCTFSDSSYVSIVKGRIAQENTSICSSSSFTLEIKPNKKESINLGIMYLRPGETQILDTTIWHHFAMTKNGLDGSLFFDGRKITSSKYDNVPYIWRSLLLGATQGCVSCSPIANYFGYLDEVRISNTVRSEQEIWQSYLSNSPYQIDSSTIMHFQFDNDSGNSFENAVNGKKGILFGGVSFSEGKFGSGLRFDGIDDYGRYSETIPKDKMTLEFWYKSNDTSGVIAMLEYAYNTGIYIYNEKENYKILWATGDTSSRIIVTPKQTTIYHVAVSDGVTTCTDSIKITVHNIPPAPSASSLFACQGYYGIPLSANALPGHSLRWYTSPTDTSGNTLAPIHFAQISGLFYYYVSQINENTGCESPRTTIYVTIAPSPILNVSSPITICSRQSTILTASGATTYSWSPATGLSATTGASVTASPTTTTTYTVTGINGGCTASKTVTVTVNPTPTVNAISDLTICNGSNIGFIGFSGSVSGTIFNWTNSQPSIGLPASGTGNIQSFTAINTGSNPVVAIITMTPVTISGGITCTGTSRSFTITVNPTSNLIPSVALTTSGNNVPAGTSITFTATPTNGGTNPQFSFRVNGVQVQSGPSNTFTTNNLSNGQVVTCVLTSSIPCISNLTATSNAITMSIQSNVIISGRIYHTTGTIIPSVTVGLQGGLNTSILTNSQGRYSFSVPPPASYTVTPSKNNDANRSQGVDVLDVLQMQAHILGQTMIPGPYRIIAGDVNNDQAINILDIVAIKRLILAIDNSFTGNRLWAFIDSTQTFPNPAAPFPYRSSISLPNLGTHAPNRSFAGVKLGDVNEDWAPVPGLDEVGSGLPMGRVVQLYYDTLSAQAGDIVSIPVRTRHFSELLGMQFSIGFHAGRFDLVGIESKAISLEFNNRMAQQGIIPMIWAQPGNQPVSLSDGTVLFNLVLRKKQSSELDKLELLKDHTPSRAFSKGYTPFGIVLTSGAITEKQKAPEIIVRMESMDIYPNPGKGFFKVILTSKYDKQVSLQVTDAAGKVVMEVPAGLIRGNNTINLNMQGKAAGMYYLKAKGMELKDVKKFIIMN